MGESRRKWWRPARAHEQAGAHAAAEEAELPPSEVARDAEEALTSALQDSDTAGELLQDSAEQGAEQVSHRRLFAALGLALTASAVLAGRRLHRGKRGSARLPRRFR